jgi:hypothetical protein
MDTFLRLVISFAALALAGAHTFFPSVTIDSVAVTLLAFALLPWIPTLFRNIQLPAGVKSIELPGGLKIEGQEIKEEIEKVILSRDEGAWRRGHEDIGPTGPYKPKEVQESRKSVLPFATDDPNLSLVGLRIEIEKRIIRLSEAVGLEPDRRPLSQLLRELHGKGILSNSAADGLTQLVSLGNMAAHGRIATPDIPDVVWELGPSLLRELDAIAERA